LFQDIYVWAGKKRIVEISKDGKQFFPTSHFDNAFRYIDQLIVEFKKIPKNNKEPLAEKLAKILDTKRVFKTIGFRKRFENKSHSARQKKCLRTIYERNN